MSTPIVVKKNAPRFILRAQVLYFVVTAVLIIAILAVGARISGDIAEEAAYRMARQNAIEVASNFQVYMNPHMRMMQQMSHSTAIARWLSDDPYDPSYPWAKSAAFNEIMGHAQTWPEARYMFTFADTLRSYNFFTHLESVDDFTHWGYLEGTGGTGNWFYNTLAAEPSFITNIQRDQPDAYGNFDLLIWSNHRIYYEGRLVGVFTLGSSFDDIFNAAFGGIVDDNKRAYILDRNGLVRLDSSGQLELFVDGVPIFPAVPEADQNPELAATIAAHLHELNGGLFPLGTFTQEAVRLERGGFAYAAISPIVGTDWSVMVLSARVPGMNPQYYFLIAASIVFLLASAIGANWLIRRFVLIPLQEMERQKAIERQEREARDMMTQLLDEAPIFIEYLDENFNPTHCNKSTAELFGLDDPSEFITKYDELSPEFQPGGRPSKEMAAELLRKAMDEGYLRFEWMHQTLSGEPLPVDTTVIRIEHNGKPMLIGYNHDLRAIKEATYDAEELNRLFFEASPIIMNIWDDEHNLLSTTPQSAKMFGCSSEEEYIANFFETSPKFQPDGSPSDEAAMTLLKQAFDEGYVQLEWMHRTLDDGQPMPVEVTMVRFSRKGKFYVAAYTVDLRPVKAAMDERVRLMFDATPLIIEFWSRDFMPLDCNKTALEYLGLSSTDAYMSVMGDHYKQTHPGMPVFYEYLSEVVKSGTCRFEFIDYKLSGEERVMDIYAVSMKINGEDVIVTYSRDITREREIELEIKQAEAERKRIDIAEESNRAKTAFLARMSHEIRTPISAVLGISEIELQSPHLLPRVEESFAKINDSAQMLTNMVNDILDLSKIEAGKLEIIVEEYETEYLISDASHMHLTHLGEKDIEFKMFVDENLPTHLIGDQMRIGQILNNLLSNAIKYTERGSVELAFQYGQDETLILSVSDTGFGMTQEQLDELHHDYSRFHEHENRFISGTGLGMSIVNSLVQMMYAEIDIESEPGVGTKVVVIIPQESAGPDVLGECLAESLQKFERTVRDEKKFKFTPELMPYGKVLVVDDLEQNLYVTKGLLAFYELEVETCISGVEAVKKIEEGNTYDLILMDYMMPVMNGTDAMRKIRDTGYEKSIVVLTANAMIGVAEKFMEDGFDGFISKPINTTHLNTILIKHIRDKQSPGVLLTTAAAVASAKTASIDNFQNNESILKKLRELFVKRHKDAPAEIRAAIDTGDLFSANLQIHSLKSAAGLIHEKSLLQAAQDCEDILSAGAMPSEGALATLFGEFESVYAELADAAASVGASDEEKKDVQDVLDLLDELEPLLVEQNVESGTIVAGLKGFPQAAILVAQVENYEYSAAIKSMETLRFILG